MPEKNSVVAGGIPVMIGTRKVAPNMATTCCIPTPMVSGQLRRSSGLTTSPGRMDLPLPWSFHLELSMLIAGSLSENVGAGRESPGATLPWNGPGAPPAAARPVAGITPAAGKNRPLLEVATKESMNAGLPAHLTVQ